MHPVRPITVVGSINQDVVVRCAAMPREGETVRGQTITYGGGGKGANQAYAAARLGGNVQMIGRIGSDAYGTEARAALQQAGCDITGVRQAGSVSGQALVIVDGQGANSIVVIDGANGLFSSEELCRDTTLLKVGGIILLQLEVPLDTVGMAAATAKTAGSSVILDPAPAQPLSDILLSNIDILTPNQTEIATLLGTEEMSGARLAEAAKHLCTRGPRAVIVKMGAKGCLLVDGEQVHFMAAPCVKAVDTTGAGDIFNAALAVKLAEGETTISACEFALSAASLSVTRNGAQAAAPDRAEVEAFMIENAQ